MAELHLELPLDLGEPHCGGKKESFGFGRTKLKPLLLPFGRSSELESLTATVLLETP